MAHLQQSYEGQASKIREGLGGEGGGHLEREGREGGGIKKKVTGCKNRRMQCEGGGLVERGKDRWKARGPKRRGEGG